MRRGVWALALALVSGCAGLRDTFAPYQPHPQEVEALLAQQHLRPHYDAAVVLGCPAEPDGAPSLCQRCRVQAAVAAWRAGQVGVLLFSGGAAHSPQVEADTMGELAVDLGVPPGAVLRERRALTTWQNVRYARRLLEEHHLVSALVVSTAAHLPRARRMARFWGLDRGAAGYLACDR